jgi:hypothetical protein
MIRRRADGEDLDAFVSYAREDSDWAARLVGELGRRGIRIWFDRENLLPGQDWNLEMDKAIERSRFFLAILSTNSVSKQGVVQREVKRAMALAEKKPEGSTYVVPIRIDDCMPADPRLAKLHWLDLFEDWEGGIRTLMKVLVGEGKVGTPSEADEGFRRHLGKFRHAILGPVQSLASAARLLISISQDAGADEDAISRISCMIDQEMELIRLWRGNQALFLSSPIQLQLRRQPLRPIVERVISRWSPILLQRNNKIRLEWRTFPDLVCALDGDAVELMLSNLIENARKYSFYNRPINVGVEKERTTLRLWIEDVGHGIPLNILQSLSESFLPANRVVLDSAMHGEGLGLKVVRSLAIAHGGDLFCQSWSLGQGDGTDATPYQVRFLVTVRCNGGD